MPRSAALALFLASLLLVCAACDQDTPRTDNHPGAAATASSPAASTAPAATASPSAPNAPPATTRMMPPRPVPTTSPTVFVTMPESVQLQAIQYMAALEAPQPNDAPADAAYARQIADHLRAVGRTDVVSSGRRIDILLDKGCDATLPREAVARHTGASLVTLLAHGVLVVRCADHAVQCLQSTRDATDVLCTHK